MGLGSCNAVLVCTLLGSTAGLNGGTSSQYSERACVVVHVGGGDFKEKCVDITDKCQHKNCPSDTVCGLNLDEEIECFPKSVKDFENCGPEPFRLSQPCPADAGIRGFGEGCTFCVGGNPFLPPEPPSTKPPGNQTSDKSGNDERKACVVAHIGDGNFKRECSDISYQCSQKNCPDGTVCGVNLDEKIQCFPKSVKDFENCGPELFRLSQPCPADAGIRGFGQGCTFCTGGNPFLPPNPPKPESSGIPSSDAVRDNERNACVVVHIGDGNFKKECIDIAEKCRLKNCPSDAVCGLNLDEEVECFPKSVKGFENCGPDSFRLSQPCPADAGIRGFGQGCTFCVGGNPFLPPNQPKPRPQQIPTFDASGDDEGKACVVVHIGEGNFKKGCIDITDKCQRKNCPDVTVCGLNLDEEVECFPKSVRDFENCGPEPFRLSQPCPADAGIRGFGQGCTYCVGGNPFLPPEPPLPGPTRSPTFDVSGHNEGKACVVVQVGDGSFKKECLDISYLCSQRNCPYGTVCGLNLDEELKCFPKSVKDFENCGPELLRLSQPCPADAGIRGFGQGCTFCIGGNPFLPPEPPSAKPPSIPTFDAFGSIEGKACVVAHIGDGIFKRECSDISYQCSQKNCPDGTVCGLNLDEEIQCFPKSVKDFENCGSEPIRLSQPCPADAGIRGFGQGCTFCFGGNAFPPSEPPSLEPPGNQTSDKTGKDTRRACIVVFAVDGKVKRECINITEGCRQANCPSDTVCGLNLDEVIECFPKSVKDFENCGPESLRLSQPCPADAGVRGFGRGCTFCIGGNPFAPSTPAFPTGTSTATPTTTSTEHESSERVCISRYLGGGKVRRGCLDLTYLCAALGCPSDRICALDRNEQPACFAASQLPLKNCVSELERITRPCPEGAELVAYGVGCNFCRGLGPIPPAPTNTPPQRACLVSAGRRQCVDISAQCARLGCSTDTTCALEPSSGLARCFAAHLLQVHNCGPEPSRLDQPCPEDSQAVAFGTGCTYCRHTGLLPPARACVRRWTLLGLQRSLCYSIRPRCALMRCPANTECVLDFAERFVCYPTHRLKDSFCGSEEERKATPCGPDKNKRLLAYGAGCNYCI